MTNKELQVFHRFLKDTGNLASFYTNARELGRIGTPSFKRHILNNKGMTNPLNTDSEEAVNNVITWSMTKEGYDYYHSLDALWRYIAYSYKKLLCAGYESDGAFNPRNHMKLRNKKDYILNLNF